MCVTSSLMDSCDIKINISSVFVWKMGMLAVLRGTFSKLCLHCGMYSDFRSLFPAILAPLHRPPVTLSRQSNPLTAHQTFDSQPSRLQTALHSSADRKRNHIYLTKKSIKFKARLNSQRECNGNWAKPHSKNMNYLNSMNIADQSLHDEFIVY